MVGARRDSAVNADPWLEPAVASTKSGADRRLVAILASPPLRTSGARTRARLDLAGSILGATSVIAVNLLDIPTDDVNGIAAAGKDAAAWLASRPRLEHSLRVADDALLAWGTATPSGPARQHHRSQICWLSGRLLAVGLRVWTVGGQTRHPSRWQRYTSHAYPQLQFIAGLRASLCCGLPDAAASSTQQSAAPDQ